MNEIYKTPHPELEKFTRIWDLSVDDIAKRDNFKEGHLEQLTILCHLYQDFDDMTAEIKVMGRVHESDGRHGIQIKVNPLVTQRDKVTAEIRAYSKLLGLLLEKDKEVKPGDDDGWG